MSPTYSLEQLLADPQLTRAQIEQLDAEDRANGIQMVRVLPGIRWHGIPDHIRHAISARRCHEQRDAINALRRRA